jgi:hypothetical protein
MRYQAHRVTHVAIVWNEAVAHFAANQRSFFAATTCVYLTVAYPTKPGGAS